MTRLCLEVNFSRQLDEQKVSEQPKTVNIDLSNTALKESFHHRINNNRPLPSLYRIVLQPGFPRIIIPISRLYTQKCLYILGIRNFSGTVQICSRLRFEACRQFWANAFSLFRSWLSNKLCLDTDNSLTTTTSLKCSFSLGQMRLHFSPKMWYPLSVWPHCTFACQM